MINRSAIIVQPKEPFSQWLQSIPDPITMSLEELNEDPTIYLIPTFENEEELTELLSLMYDFIFKEILSGWWLIEEDWPQKRTFKMFKKWFDISTHSVVLDMVDAPLEEE